MPHLLAVLFALAMTTTLAWGQTARVFFSGVPETITPGEQFSVLVEYTADIQEFQRRGVLILEALDASNQSVILKLDSDNALRGWEGPSGLHEFHVTLNAPLPPEITFRAYMTQYGLNDVVEAYLETYPTDGTYTYEWTGNGVTQDLFYLGGLVISNNSGNDTYCSGITFETFLLSYENYLAINSLPPQIDDMITTVMMKSFRTVWYGATGVPEENEYQSTLAIESRHLGFILDDLEDARQGDFIQLWRHSGSGHNCIFQSWGRDAQGQINRLYYWSSQNSTNGIGFHSETVSNTTGIDPARLHIARVMRPRSDEDWSLRYPEPDISGTGGITAF